jgi:hypothetical protein
MQAGIRWVPISPLVEAPQMKNVPASSEKSRERRPIRRPRSARTAGFSVRTGVGVTASSP